MAVERIWFPAVPDGTLDPGDRIRAGIGYGAIAAGLPTMLSDRYLAELRKGVNSPNVIVEMELDGGTKKFGFHTGGFTDVNPALKTVSSLQNRLDQKKGFSTRGDITLVITGRDNFKALVRDEYLKNRTVTRKDGFISEGFGYDDYASTFKGKIVDWSRKGDELSIRVADQLVDATKKIPEENSSKTQSIDYRNTNPVDIVKDIITDKLGIDAALVDTAGFNAERDLWLENWTFDRVITAPKDANKYLNELQAETNSFIFHDGDKLSFKVFAPPIPGEEVDEWNETRHILKDSLSCKSGYNDHFYNRVLVYFDYDESGGEGADAFDSLYIAVAADSQSSSKWDEVKTKTIKSKWIRSKSFTLTSNVTGVTLYHVSSSNPAGKGYIKFNALDYTLQWRSSDGSDYGEKITVTTTGTQKLPGMDTLKYARVIVDASLLPTTDQTDEVTISPLQGELYAGVLASQLLRRFKDPVATVSFQVGINHIDSGGNFRKIAGLVDITTDEAFEYGDESWTAERVMITSLRPDFGRSQIQVEGIETKIYTNNYGFIAPAVNTNDWDAASSDEKKFCFIGDTNNELGSANDEGFIIW